MLKQLAQYDINTIVLYVIVIFLSSLFAFLSSKRKVSDNCGSGIVIHYNNRFVTRQSGGSKYIFAFYFVSFLISMFFVTFSGVGTDKTSYLRIFEYSQFGEDDIEIGYSLLMTVSKAIINNPIVFTSIISFSTILFVYIGIWKCRDHVNVGFAVLSYLSLYYLQSMDLMRMYFALSFLVLGAHNIFQKKYLRYYIYIIIAILIHYSVIFVLIAYSISIILSSNRIFSRKTVFVIIAVLSIIIVLFGTQIIGKISSINFFIIKRYAVYTQQNTEASALGLKWLFVLIPFVLSLLLLGPVLRYNTCDFNRRIFIIITVYMFLTAIMSIMNYSVPGLERARTTLNMPIIIMLPYALKQNLAISDTGVKYSFAFFNRKIAVSKGFISALLVLYYVYSLLLYMSGYLETDGIDKYQFIWDISSL